MKILIFIIGILYQGACAKNIGLIIEKIVNGYEFDKTKVTGEVCDKGSNFVRLLGQLIFEQENVHEDALDGFEGRNLNNSVNLCILFDFLGKVYRSRQVYLIIT